MNTPLLSSEANVLEFNNSLRLAPGKLATMFQEGATGASTPNTPVTADTNPVATIYDLSNNAQIARTGNPPTLGSGGGRNSFWIFDGTNDRWAVLNSSGLFKGMHAPSPIGCLMFWFKMDGGDASLRFIVSNSSNDNAKIGFTIFRSSGNKITVNGNDGAGSVFYTFTSTTSITVASGWTGLILSVNGTGASGGRLILINSSGTTLEDATFNIPTSRGSTANATDALFIGWRAILGAGQSFFGSIGDFIMRPTAITTQLIDAFRVYNPARTTTEFSPILYSLLDANDPSTLFSDAAGTTPANDGDPIRYWRNKKASLSGLLNRDLTSAASGTSPIWRATQQNGLGALEFDGTDDNLDFQNNLVDELGGKYTMFVVAQNRRTATGSHFLEDNNYLVITGSAYGGAGNHPHWANHGESPDVAGVDAANLGSDLPELFVFRRNGTQWDCWNTDKTKTATNSADTNGSHIFTNMGESNHSIGGSWWFDGYMIYLAKYSGLMTDHEIESQIDQLKAKYNLP